MPYPSGLNQIFADHGEVQSARGFGFVEMDAADVDAVIGATDGYAVDGATGRGVLHLAPATLGTVAITATIWVWVVPTEVR
jgi:hypothetical protein